MSSGTEESSIWHALCYSFPNRCDCHTQQQHGLQSFIPAFLTDQGSPTLRLGCPISRAGDAQTLQPSMELKVCILTLSSALWTEQDHWGFCPDAGVGLLQSSACSTYTHRSPDVDINTPRHVDAGGNPFPEAQVQSLPNLLSSSGLWTLISSANHLFSLCCCESTHAYLILFISNESSNT